MARLAEYMADLAVMLGEPASVHFVRIDKGSAVLVQRVDDVAAPKVREQIERVRTGEGPADAMKAFRRTNDRLKADNSVGLLSQEGGGEIIRFPGREAEEPVSFGAFNQDGTLDGKVIVVGGKADPVPVHIQQGDVVYNCQASRDVARTLGQHLFMSELRLRGMGRWSRDPEGTWTMHRFTITSFEVLDEQPLSMVVAELRAIPGNGWDKVADPWRELMDLRGRDDEH